MNISFICETVSALSLCVLSLKKTLGLMCLHVRMIRILQTNSLCDHQVSVNP